MKLSHDAKLKAKIFWEGGLKTRSIIRGFEVETDEPKSKFGTNMAPAPMEVFISGIGSCLLSSFIGTILKARINIEDCVVVIQGYTNICEKKEKIVKAEITLTVWADKKHKKKLEQCFEISKKICLLTDAISFPLDMIMQFKEER